MENKKDNILQFPVRKPEQAQKPQTDTPASQEKPKASRKSKKSKVLLGATLALSLLANRLTTVSSQSDMASTSSGRGIASVNDNRTIEPSDRDSNWERQLAKDLALRSSRELANVRVGKSPTQEDNLRFSYLGHGYVVTFKNGRIAEAHWPANQPKEGLKRFENSTDFIYDNKALMPVEFASARSLGVVDTQEGHIQTYALLNTQGAQVAEVQYGLDKEGRLLALKISSATLDQ